MTRILAVNGSYRQGGIVDQAVEEAAKAAREAGASVEIILLREVPIEFCANCRHCTQRSGDTPGECVHNDRMRELIHKIEDADGFILASPTNFYSVTAIFKRFMERLVVFAYWPWGTGSPRHRLDKPHKPALLIASSAAPGWIGRFTYATLKQLRMTARTIGAKPIGSTFIGMVSQQEHPCLAQKYKDRVRRLVTRLV